MPIINIRFIKDVVATEEQKQELIVKMTDTFVEVLGDVVRPFVYTIIDEVPIGMWGIAGVPMPDLQYLTGPQHAEAFRGWQDQVPPATSNKRVGGERAYVRAHRGEDRQAAPDRAEGDGGRHSGVGDRDAARADDRPPRLAAAARRVQTDCDDEVAGIPVELAFSRWRIDVCATRGDGHAWPPG